MLNWIFAALIASAVVLAAFTGRMPQVTQAAFDSARTAVELSIALIGQMALWLGLMGVLRQAGLVAGLGHLLRPVMTRLFPSVPKDHPAMGSMLMNMAANILGLDNAATPFGLKAMKELDALNPHKGISTDAMAMFLVINTSGLAVIPNTVVALRAAAGSAKPASIIVPSVLGTLVSTVLAIIICRALERRRLFSVARALQLSPADLAPAATSPAAPADEPPPEALPASKTANGPVLLIVASAALALGAAGVRHLFFGPLPAGEALRGMVSDWVLPALVLCIVLVGLARRVRIYEAFVTSAKEAFQVSVTIIPYLVAILVAVGLFRASGAMQHLTDWLGPITRAVGFPAEALPMALIRPLSGGGARGVLAEAFSAYGPDSFIGHLTSLIAGSSETTFYVLAVYFGAAQVKAVRHTLAACLIADGVGLVVATLLAHLFYGA